MSNLSKTKSVCPECKKTIDAKLVDENGKVYMIKGCKKHGSFKELCYHKDFYDRISADIPRDEPVTGCPHACESCKSHKTATLLAVIDVTSRCNLNCEYCFANANDRKYEPTLKQMKDTISFLRKEQPTCNAILFSGGEPTLRDDFLKILDHARLEKFDCLMIATNGIKLSNSAEYMKQLVEHGVGILYLSFDGLDDSTNRYKKSHRYIEKLISNCRKTGMRLMLVPAIGKGINNHQVFDLINFAIDNNDVVRGINFQPIGFSGRAEHDSIERYTIPDLCKDLEAQSGGQLKANDFFAIDTCKPLTDMFEIITKQKTVSFSMHPMCGMATYIFVRNGKAVPITRMLDVEKFIHLCKDYVKDIKNKKGLEERLITAKFLIDMQGTIKRKDEVMPLLMDLILKKDYDALTRFHENSIFVGAMHFQDPYNFDVKRVQRCGVHYVTPGKTIIPFCAYNNFGYREKVEKEFSDCGQNTLGFEKV